MKSSSRVRITFILCSMIALISGCSTSVLVNQWSDSSYRGPVLTNMLIIAVRNDPVRRRVWEDAFVGELARHGVKATQSYRFFPDAIPDSSGIAGIVAKNGFDGIIITRRLPKIVSTQYVNGYVSTESETRFSERRQQFQTYYHEVEHPGYVDTQKIANRSIDVWTTDAKSRMIWSAVSETPEPATAEAVHHDIVNLVTGDLTRKAIIANAK
ncbi:MAG: hypothetical protein WBM07_16180 [Chitinivibrionales bacterium]